MAKSRNWSGSPRIAPKEDDGISRETITNLPILNAVEQIKRLTREQWLRGHPVKLRGVVTTVVNGGFFIQDQTSFIYARWHAPTDNDVTRLGDFWEIEGKTFAEFAFTYRRRCPQFL